MTLSLNSWGTVLLYKENEKKTITLHVKNDVMIKCVFVEEEPEEMNGLKECKTLHGTIQETIRDYLIVKRKLCELHYKDTKLKWSDDGRLQQCESGSFYQQKVPEEHRKPSQTVTAVIDEVLRALTAHFSYDGTWIHHMIFDIPIIRGEFQWCGLSPDSSCNRMELWLEFIRDLMLLPPHMPIVQRRVLPGKVGVFGLMKATLETRRRQPIYAALKKFLMNIHEDMAHKALYIDFLRSITSSSSLDVDSLTIDDSSDNVRTLMLYYQELRSR